MNYLPKSLVWDITQFLTYDEMEESFSEEMDDPEFWNFKIAHEFPDQKLPEEGGNC